MSEIRESIASYGLHAGNDAPKNNIFSHVGIVGCGFLGQAIALLCARRGFDVVFLELSQQRVDQAMDGMSHALDLEIERWGLTDSEKKSILSRISGTTVYADLAKSDIVIEAIKSRTREKCVPDRKSIFKKAEEVVSEECLIVTNSTTLVITELAAELDHPERCASLHFIFPVEDAEIVEVARGLHTSEAAYERVQRFAKMLKKTVIPVVESPGIISTRLIAPMINEACSILMEGVATKEDIDTTMRLGMGNSMGPFEAADLFGIDRVTRWLDNLYNEFGNTRYKASPMLKKLMRAGKTGRSVGEGFYKYDKYGSKIHD
ncbi:MULTISPECIES: 3-hydroxyacyl-CoA dehydrogenase family protein [Persicobacter]|uniref:3-hydroxybutyryl-CoA dehydrogenase n=1 Tax=Persicobacter diffluens TaxID=981 RepID=A0AAN4VVP3_9BACT|nr:3-hydroxyacyl-CoA dehydrogenase NAD-binding domain-containing protein [Persicobacter sp. CCB-QB2]GJM60816.1 3-hydroxybutyryl-CoA dehydrogenase [Persicobacter diffluens]